MEELSTVVVSRPGHLVIIGEEKQVAYRASYRSIAGFDRRGPGSSAEVRARARVLPRVLVLL